MSTIQLSAEKQAAYDGALSGVQTSEKEFWENMDMLCRIAVPHILEGGNVSKINTPLRYLTGSRRRDLVNLLKSMVPYKVAKDGKGQPVFKAKDAKRVTKCTQKADEYLKGRVSIRTLLTHAMRDKAEAAKAELTPEQRQAKAIKSLKADAIKAIEVGLSLQDCVDVLASAIQETEAAAAA